MKWPFMLRSTHERIVQQMADDAARNVAAAADHAAHLSLEQVFHANLRAAAAEAQLRDLAAPILEIVRRTASVTVATATPPQSPHFARVVCCLTFQDKTFEACERHARVLGYVAADMVRGAIDALRIYKAKHGKEPAEGEPAHE